MNNDPLDDGMSARCEVPVQERILSISLLGGEGEVFILRRGCLGDSRLFVGCIRKVALMPF